MAEAEDYRPLQSKHKAITAFLPYAVWQERDGRSEILYAVLHAARASRMPRFMWFRVNLFVSTLLSEASPRAAVLASPYIPWYLLTHRGDMVQWWVATASVAPYSEEVTQSVVDALLQIASAHELVQYIPVNLWSRLTDWPSLPPICWGRYAGTHAHVVEAVRALKDAEVLKSYLILVWSEWDMLSAGGFDEMRTLIEEDFSGTGMGHHRADLIQRLDHVLWQSDRGLEYLRQHSPQFDEDDVRIRKDEYGKLRDASLETNTEAIGRTPRLPNHTRVLTPTPYVYRIPGNIYVYTPSPVSIVPQLGQFNVLALHFIHDPTLTSSARLVMSPDTFLIISYLSRMPLGWDLLGLSDWIQ